MITVYIVLKLYWASLRSGKDPKEIKNRFQCGVLLEGEGVMFYRTIMVAVVSFFWPLSVVAQTVGVAEYQYYELNIPVTVTGTSGNTSGTQRFLRSNILRRNGFLEKVVVEERRDAPCQIDASFYGADNEDQQFAECGTSNGQVGSPSGYHAVRVPVGVMVTSVRVCLNRSRNKIKGMRMSGNFAPCLLDENAVYSVVPKPDKLVRSKTAGTTVAVPRDGHYLRKCSPSWFDEWKRPNCNSWRPTQTCPAGQVAYGVGIRYANGNGGRRRIHGVQLACAPFALKE